MPDLFPYQEGGVEFLAERGRALLADQPGLGKTPQAIMAARKLVSMYALPSVCVVCPLTAKENWRREWFRWWPSYGGALTVLNYDVLSTVGHVERQNFLRARYDLLICDEAHRLKSPGAKRTKTIYEDYLPSNPTTLVWLLTGTPSRNHAGELWTHLNALRPDLIHDRSGRPMSVEQFENHYCDVGFDERGNRVIRGSKNTAELREVLLGGGFMLRRLKRDVQSELPDLIFDEYPLSLDRDEAKAPAYKGLGLNDSMTDDEIIDRLRAGDVEFSTERRLTGMLKAPNVARFVEEELEAPGKIIVFFHHKDVGAVLLERLVMHNPVIVQGGTKDAQAQVDRFQTDPECRVFLGQITACGEALNITAASQVVFAEASWSPADNYQAACRAHRIGMGDKLVVRFLSAKRTIDQMIQRTLARKTQELSDLFD